MSTLLMLVLAAGASPQMHDMHGMGGMHMPGMAMPPRAKAAPRPKPKAKPRPARTAKPAAPSAAPACAPEHQAMGHCTSASAHGVVAGVRAMPDMPDMAMPAPPAGTLPAAVPSGTDQPAGNAPPPAPPTDRAAARVYDPVAMAAADRRMRAEHGGMTFGQILFDLAEVQVRDGHDGLRWDGEGWYGGDRDRLVVKTEGDGRVDRIDRAEVQALYSRAIGPYTDLQGGLRQDLGAGARRTYATIGVEGLAPYWFQFEGALFVSDKGDVLGRVQGYYDQRITQRLILQPRVELNLAAQDVPASGIAAGLSETELGLRLRYEIRREFAPYVGATWQHRRRDDDSGGAVVLGLRSWF
jgi:copper resistance protein B